jgi:hypothetical protein
MNERPMTIKKAASTTNLSIQEKQRHIKPRNRNDFRTTS